MRLPAASAVILLASAAAASAQTAPAPAARCAGLTTLQVPGLALSITKAEWIPAGPAPTAPNAPPGAMLPAYCRVDGMLDKRQGTGGQTFGIGFALSLPDPWNGRFLMQGGGGLNGRVAPPLGNQAAGATPALARGFAVVTTDTGHQSTTAFDAAFRRDQQAALDFAYIAIVTGIVNACDANDGVRDGMIFDTKSCSFNPQTLVCSGAKTEGCLSPQQASAVARAFAGPKDSKGNQVYPGFFYDTGIAATGGGIPGVISPGAGPPFGPVLDLEQDVDREARAAGSDALQIVADTWSWTNLNTFSSRGGKLLFYHGVSDPWFSAQDTVDYYTRLGAANGGADRVRTWSRLFLSPGMGHCGGGPAALDTFDLLTAMVDWVETGVAPDAVTATGRAFPGRSRPLCAYPKHAHYKGQGDPEDARNFECRD